MVVPAGLVALDQLVERATCPVWVSWQAIAGTLGISDDGPW